MYFVFFTQSINIRIETLLVLILSLRLAMAESELALSESKINEIGALLSRAKEETTSMNKQHQSELKREREASRNTTEQPMYHHKTCI